MTGIALVPLAGGSSLALCRLDRGRRRWVARRAERPVADWTAELAAALADDPSPRLERTAAR